MSSKKWGCRDGPPDDSVAAEVALLRKRYSEARRELVFQMTEGDSNLVTHAVLKSWREGCIKHSAEEGIDQLVANAGRGRDHEIESSLMVW